MRKKRNSARILLFVLLFVILIALSTTVLAVDQSATGLGRIGEFFQNSEWTNHSVLIDFGIFFLIFFSLCWLGFSKWFGGQFGKPGTGKGAVIGLSLGLALMFSFGLVITGKFTIAKTFPIAKNFLFLAFWILLYAILSNNNLIGNNTFTKKAISFILAGLIVYILLNITTAYICTLENNEEDPACQGGIFTAGHRVLAGVWSGLGLGGGGGPSDGVPSRPGRTGRPSRTGPPPVNDTAYSRCQRTGDCPGMNCRLAIDIIENPSLMASADEANRELYRLIYGPREPPIFVHERWRNALSACQAERDPEHANHRDYLHALGGYHYHYGIHLADTDGGNDLPGAIRELSTAANITSSYRDDAEGALRSTIRDQFQEIQDQINQQSERASQLERDGQFTEATALRREIVEVINTLRAGE